MARIRTRVWLFSLLLPLAAPASAAEWRMAPLNPAFGSPAAPTAAVPSAAAEPTGFRPPPADLSHLSSPSRTRRLDGPFTAPPSSYDLRTLGKVTGVRDQGTAGSCWAFAAYGSLESFLMPGAAWDFSENNMKNRHGFDYAHDAGGNHLMATAYLARWSGPVAEIDDPYNPRSGASPSGLSPRRHIQQVLFLPNRSGPTDNDAIKQALMAYGAVSTSMYYTSAGHVPANKAYYYRGAADANHAVTIVGWNDSFSRSRFTGSSYGTPAGDGAFIVKNSWGSGWGESGYFHVSYYDSKIGRDNAVFENAEAVSNYGHIYEYDPLGYVISIGSSGQTAWAANVFTATAADRLKAVGFYALSPDTSYEVRVYTAVVAGPTSGSLISLHTGTAAAAGYHTVALPGTVQLTPGEKFSIVLKLTTPGYAHPIAVEYPMNGYSSAAAAAAGQSFVSPTGASWTDLTAQFAGANVCIKGYALGTPGIVVVSPNGGESWVRGTARTISWAYTAGAHVKIELLKGGVISRTVVADTTTGAGGAGTLLWTIPADQDPGADYRIRVAASGGTPSDTSDADFSILAAESPTVTVVDPAAGVSWEAGSSRTVSWRYAGAVGDNVNIKLLRSGVEIATIAAAAPAGTGGAGSFAWAIPAGLAPGTAYRVSVESVSVPAARGSSGEFSITTPAPVEFLALAAPNGGEIVRPGERMTVEWRYQGSVGSSVRIDLLKAGTAILAVADGIPLGAGRYDWTVPVGTAAGADYRVRISSREVPAFSDVSDGFFTVSAGGIDVTAPAAGDTWHPGTVRTIRWTHAAQGYNYIRIFIADGASQFPLAGPIPIGAGGTGSWQWRIPRSVPVGGAFRIRIVSTVDPAMAGESGAFSIAAPSIALLSPAAGGTWRHGERKTISWTFTGGDDDYVRVELVGAAETTPVARSVPIGRAGAGSFAWTVPPGCAPGSGYRIRVSSLNRPDLAGESGAFSIAGR